MRPLQEHKTTTLAGLLVLFFSVFFLMSAQPAEASFWDWFGFGGGTNNSNDLDGKWGTGPSSINMANTGLTGLTNNIFGQGIVSICDDSFPRYQGVAKRVVHCIQDSIIWGTAQYFDGVYSYLKGVIYAFFTLVVIFFGVGILSQSVENISRDTFILVVKLAVVMGLLENMDLLYIWLVDIMEGLLSLVVQFGVSGFGFIQCPFGGVFVDVWGRVDCMLDTLIGIGNKGPGLDVGTGPAGLSRGLFNFFVTSAPGSALGLILLVMGFYVIFSLAMAIARAMQVYLMGFIGVSFMMAVGPLFIPLLALKQTKDYFDKWTKIILAFILQPVILFAFINMSLIAIDIVVVGGEDSFLRTVAGSRVLDSDGDGWTDGNFNVNSFLEDEDLLLDTYATIGVTGVNLSPLCSQVVETIQGYEFAAEQAGDLSGLDCSPDGGGLQLPFKQVDYAKLADIRMADAQEPITGIDISGASTPEEELQMKSEQMRAIVTTNALIMMLCAFLFMSMLNYIPAMAHDLSGGAYETPNLYYDRKSGEMLGGELPFQPALLDGAQGMSQGIRQAISNVDGAAVVGGLATAGGIAAAVDGAFDAIGRPDSAQEDADRVFTYAAAAEMLDGKVIQDANGNVLSSYEAYRTLGANDLRDIARSDESVIQLNESGGLDTATRASLAPEAPVAATTMAGAGALQQQRQEQRDEERREADEARDVLLREQGDLEELQQRREIVAMEQEILTAQEALRLEENEVERVRQQEELTRMQEELAFREMEANNAFSFGGSGTTVAQFAEAVSTAQTEEELQANFSALGITEPADQYAAARMTELTYGSAAAGTTLSNFMDSREAAFESSYGAALDTREATIASEFEAGERSRENATDTLSTLDAQIEEQRRETRQAAGIYQAQEGDAVRAQRNLDATADVVEGATQLDTQRRAQAGGYDAGSALGIAAAASEREAEAAERTVAEARTTLNESQATLAALEQDGATPAELRAAGVEVTPEITAAYQALEAAERAQAEDATPETEDAAERARETYEETARSSLETTIGQQETALTGLQQNAERERAEANQDIAAARVETEREQAARETAEDERSTAGSGGGASGADTTDVTTAERTEAPTTPTNDDVVLAGGPEEVTGRDTTETVSGAEVTSEAGDTTLRGSAGEDELTTGAPEATDAVGAGPVPLNATHETDDPRGSGAATEGTADESSSIAGAEEAVEVANMAPQTDLTAEARAESQTDNLTAEAGIVTETDADSGAGSETVQADETLSSGGGVQAAAAEAAVAEATREATGEELHGGETADDRVSSERETGTVETQATETPEERTVEEPARTEEADEPTQAERFEAKEEAFNEAHDTYNELVAEQREREAIEEQRDLLQEIDIATLTDPSNVNGATQMGQLQTVLGTAETDLDRLTELRDERLAEITRAEEAWASETQSLDARVTAADEAREAALREYNREREAAEAAQSVSENAAQIGEVQDEIDALEDRLAALESRTPTQQTINPDRAHERMMQEIVSDPLVFDADRREQLEDVMWDAQREIQAGNIVGLTQEGGALAALSQSDRYIVLQGLAMQNPGQRTAILDAIPEGAEAGFREEFATQVEQADAALVAAERDMQVNAELALQEERERLERELAERRAQLEEAGIAARDSERELIAYDDFERYFNNITIRGADGEAMELRAFYNSLSDNQLAELHMANYIGITPQFMAEHGTLELGEGNSIDASNYVLDPVAVELPPDTHTPEDRRQMPYDEFRSMMQESAATAPVFERADGSVMSAAEAYDLLTAAQLRQMKRMWDAQRADDEMTARQAEAIARRFGGPADEVSADEMQDWLRDVQTETDAIDDAEARSLGVNPDEEDE